MNKMKVSLCLLLLVFFGGSVVFGKLDQEEVGLQLLQSLQQNDDQNVVLSPLALTRSLLLLLSKAKGQSEEELKHVLNLQQDDDVKKVQSEQEQLIQQLLDKNGEDQELTLLTRLLVNKNGVEGLKETFKRAVKEELEKEVDFNEKKVTEEVNEWLKKGSRGRFQRFFRDQLDEKNSMVLLSAQDYSGKLKDLALSQSQEREEFQNFVSFSLPLMSQMVPFLQSQSSANLRLKNNEELKSDLLELPYEKDVSLIIVQPRELEGLHYITENLTAQQLNSAIKDLLQVAPTPMKVKLPKFKVEMDLELKEVLEDFYDVKTLFNQSAAEFQEPGQRVSLSMHKAVFEMKENSKNVDTSDGAKEFRVDRPFLFVLRDNNLGVSLFFGKINHLVDEEALGLGFI